MFRLMAIAIATASLTAVGCSGAHRGAPVLPVGPHPLVFHEGNCTACARHSADLHGTRLSRETRASLQPVSPPYSRFHPVPTRNVFVHGSAYESAGGFRERAGHDPQMPEVLPEPALPPKTIDEMNSHDAPSDESVPDPRTMPEIRWPTKDRSADARIRLDDLLR